MDERRAEEVVADLALARQSVAASALAIRQRAEAAARWGGWVRENGVLLAVGALVGVVALGYVLGTRPRPRPEPPRRRSLLSVLVRALL